METAHPILKTPPIASLSEGNDHAVIDLPFTAVIDGRPFRGHSISLVNAHVAGLLGKSASAAPRFVRLVFDFDGFSVSLVTLADVRGSPGGKGEISLDFTHPSGPHLPQLRHILNAYIARDLVSLGQVIGVAGTTPPKPVKVATAGTGRKYLQGTALALLAVTLIGMAGALIYQRNFVQLLPDLGIVTLQGETLRATASGQIAFLDTAAPKGQVALAITTSNGDVLSLAMPCDCTATSLGLRVGSTVLAGEPILQLTTQDAVAVVQVVVSPDLAFDLARGDRIELSLPNGNKMAATALQGAGPNAVLIPSIPLDPTLVGQPVRVRLIRNTRWLND